MVGDPPTFKTNVIRIIVGVKYCFRYSQRNRRGAQFEEEVDLATLHPFVGLHHPVQRRRREKKLLKLEEVNERFPVMTYKAWRAQRERAGLSAEGGIAPQTNPTAPNTPLLNQTEAEGSSENDIPDSPPEEPDHPYPFETVNDPIDRSSSPEPTSPTEEITTEKDTAISSIPVPDIPEESSIAVPSSSKHRDSTFSADADPDEEESPIPDELLATSGDNCAICIELLEDEDEVRGLTCGHCYHQTCLDPWLTQRRASCPLCKADYYIPKPPPQPTDPTTTPADNASPTGAQGTVTTEHWAPLFLRPFRPVGSSPQTLGPSYPPPFTRFDHRHRIPEETTTTTDTDTPTPNPTASTHTMYGALQFPHISMRNPFRRTRRQDNAGDATERAERGEAGQSVLTGETPVAGI